MLACWLRAIPLFCSRSVSILSQSFAFSRVPFSKALTFYQLLSRGAGMRACFGQVALLGPSFDFARDELASLAGAAGMARRRKGLGLARIIHPVRRVSGKFGDVFYSALILLGWGVRGCGRKSVPQGPHPRPLSRFTGEGGRAAHPSAQLNTAFGCALSCARRYSSFKFISEGRQPCPEP